MNQQQTPRRLVGGRLEQLHLDAAYGQAKARDGRISRLQRGAIRTESLAQSLAKIREAQRG
jgi:hypothetical protein